MTLEELYQWFEYEKDIGDIIQCPKCHKYVSLDEYTINDGICTDCFDKEYLNENKK